MKTRLPGHYAVSRSGAGFQVVYHTDYWIPAFGGASRVVIPLQYFRGRGAKKRAETYKESLKYIEQFDPIHTSVEEVLNWLPILNQRQDDVKAQLEDLVSLANKLGMYDAADLINEKLTAEAPN